MTEWGDRLKEKYGTRFVFASDEWFIMAGLPIPDADYYEGYGQLENGVGMVRDLTDSVKNALDLVPADNRNGKVTIATGTLVFPYIRMLADIVCDKFPGLSCDTYGIINYYFGTDITVAGLLTGTDIIGQLKGKDLGNYLLLPDTLLRSETNILLDDMTTDDIEKALQIKVRIVKSDGESFVHGIIDP